jgi:hypothetical protein
MGAAVRWRPVNKAAVGAVRVEPRLFVLTSVTNTLRVRTGSTQTFSENNGIAGKTVPLVIARVIGGENRKGMTFREIQGGVECDCGARILLGPEGFITYDAPILKAVIRYDDLGGKNFRVNVSVVREWTDESTIALDDSDRLRIAYILEAGLAYLGIKAVIV